MMSERDLEDMLCLICGSAEHGYTNCPFDNEDKTLMQNMLRARPSISQKNLGRMTLDEIEIIESLREDNSKTWWRYGKSLEIALSVKDCKVSRSMGRGQTIIYSSMVAIELFEKKGIINEDLVKLIKTKKSKYVEALIEYGIWTEEIYMQIRAKVLDTKFIDAKANA